MNNNLKSYYGESAPEYDKVYLNPHEQNDLINTTKIFQNLYLNKTALEFACGTGYWTEQIGKTDDFGNTYQERKLENGNKYLVLKNFPSKGFLHEKLSIIANDIKVIHMEYYWIATAELNENRE